MRRPVRVAHAKGGNRGVKPPGQWSSPQGRRRVCPAVSFDLPLRRCRRQRVGFAVPFTSARRRPQGCRSPRRRGGLVSSAHVDRPPTRDGEIGEAGDPTVASHASRALGSCRSRLQWRILVVRVFVRRPQPRLLYAAAILVPRSFRPRRVGAERPSTYRVGAPPGLSAGTTPVVPVVRQVSGTAADHAGAGGAICVPRGGCTSFQGGGSRRGSQGGPVRVPSEVRHGGDGCRGGTGVVVGVCSGKVHEAR